MVARLAGLAAAILMPAAGHAAEPAFDLPQALKALATAPVPELRIPPGRYLLPRGGLLLDKVRNVTLQASGVTFVATDLTAPALQLRRCENVTVNGLTIDYDPLPFTQGTITAVDLKSGTVDFQVHQGYPELDDAYLTGRQLHLFEKDTLRWTPGAPDYYPRKIERLSPTTGRCFFPANASRLDLMQPGGRVVLAIRKKSGVNVQEGCKGLRFEEVTVHAAPGIGILVRFAEETGTYVKTRVAPGPRPSGAVEERLFSTSADAFNAAYTRKGPVIDRCEFSRMGDDSVNLHGVLLPVLKWLDDRTFLSMRPHHGDAFERLVRPGDEIRFLKEPNYALTAAGTVASIVRTAEKTPDWAKEARQIWPTSGESTSASFYHIRLTAPVRGVAAGAGSFCEIPATNAPGFVIRDSWFHDHRARGLRLMACDGLVENNRIERLKGSAITIGGEFAFWREAGWSRNLMVRGNRITDVGEGGNILLPGSYTPGAISIMARVMPEGTATRYFPGNENIVVTDNVIDGCPLSGIHVVAARGVKITRNTLRRVNLVDSPGTASDYGLEGQSPITILQAEAEMEGNRVER